MSTMIEMKFRNNGSLITFQYYLKWLRLFYDYPQEYVADRVHIVRQTYSHYETGRIYPSYSALYNLSKLYELPTCPLLRLCATNELYMDSPDDLIKLGNVDYMIKMYEERELLPKHNI